MSQIPQARNNSSNLSDTPLSISSPLSRHALPLACLVPSNRAAHLAILKAREEGSIYQTNFITEVEYRGYPHTPCFELALGGLPEHSVGWRIGRGCSVDLLLVTADDGIDDVHASFGWNVHKPGLLLSILNKQQKWCTINGRDFSEGSESIPLQNTILIGDCAFTLLFKTRTRAAEVFFQAELHKHVTRLIALRSFGNSEDVVCAEPGSKHERTTDQSAVYSVEPEERAENLAERRRRRKANLGLQPHLLGNTP
jgi:hypothetical protein